MAAAGDPCAGLQRCANGGSFIAQVVSLTPVGGPADRHHSLKLNLTFRNVSTQPVILGYKSNSSAAVDNLGNGYVFGRPGTHDTSFSGIGLVTGRAAEHSLSLTFAAHAPLVLDTRNAMRNVQRRENIRRA